MNRELEKKIREYLEEHKEEIAEELSTLVRIPSIKGAPEKDAPMGKENDRMLECAVGLFKKNGFCAEIGDTRYYATASYGEGEKTIGIFSHGDVVPVGDDWLVCEPFEAKRVGDLIVGRGTDDNKCAIVLALYIMKILKEFGIELKNRLLVYIGTNEEDGMEDIEAFKSEMPMPELSLVPDNSYPVSLGEKGICHFFYTSDTPFADITDFYGGEAYNIVSDRVTVVLRGIAGLKEEMLSRANENFEIEEKDGKIYLTAKGRPTHAARPKDSLNAAHIACELLTKCKLLCAKDREVLENAVYFLSDIEGRAFNVAASDDKFGATTSANGMSRMKDGCLSLSCDLRYGGTYSGAELEAHINASLSERGWRVTEMNNREGFSHERDNKFALAMKRAFEEATGDSEKDFYYSGGGTYARYLKNAFSIGIALMSEVDRGIIPEGHGAAHQADEYVNINDLINGIFTVLSMLLACDGIL